LASFPCGGLSADVTGVNTSVAASYLNAAYPHPWVSTNRVASFSMNSTSNLLYSSGVPRSLHAVVETPAFVSDARSLGLTSEERLTIVSWIAANPDSGAVIEGTGGARKVRFAGKGKGKSGGDRVITFFSGKDIPVFLLNVFAKNERTNLTPKERGELKAILANTVDAYRARKER